MITLKSKYKSDVLWVGSGTIGLAIINLITVSILARILAPSDFGIISITKIFIEISTFLVCLGVDQAIIQSDKIKSIILGNILFVQFVLSIAVIAVLLISSNAIAVILNSPDLKNAIRLMSVMIMFKSLTLTTQAYFSKFLLYKYQVKVDLIGRLFGYTILSIILANGGYGFYALLFAELTSSFLILIMLLVHNKIIPLIKLTISNMRELKDLYNFGKYISLSGVFSMLATQVDYIVLSKFGNTNLVGYYSRAYNLMVYPTLLINVGIKKLLFPRISILKHKKRVLCYYYERINFITLFVSIYLANVFFMFAEMIVLILLGENWSDVILPLKILSFAIPLRVLNKINGVYLTACNHVKFLSISYFIYFLLVVILSFIGFKFYQLPGLSVGVTAAMLISYLINHYYFLIKIESKFMIINYKLNFYLFTSLIIITADVYFHLSIIEYLIVFIFYSSYIIFLLKNNNDISKIFKKELGNFW